MKAVAFDLRPCANADVRVLCEQFHGYGSAGNAAVYAFGVYEDGRMVAGYLWQPPPLGAAHSVCPEAPWGVLALSRMVAVPKEVRRLQHISKPLRRQMRRLIDRTRWPVLITFHDEGQGHTGHVYKCSGWQKTTRTRSAVHLNVETGARASRYANGKTSRHARDSYTWIQRWEHWICDREGALAWMESHGWRRVPIPNKFWRSGAQAHRLERCKDDERE